MVSGKPRARSIGFALLGVVVALAVAVAAVWELRWRAEVLWVKLSGNLPAIPTGQLIEWMLPGSPVYVGELAEQPSPHSSIRNLVGSAPATLDEGKALFAKGCMHCHGAEGKGGSGPNLLAFISNSTEWDFMATAKWGRAGTAMAAQPLSDAEIWKVQSYLREGARTWAAEAAKAAGVTAVRAKINVTPEQLYNAQDHPDQWLSYSGDTSAHRYSRLDQINKGNVANMRVAWITQLRPSFKPLAATPIVTGGLIFVTEAPEGVAAIDAKSGRLVWRFKRPVDPSKLPLCCGAFNRGVAVLGDRVFVATLDNVLIALDAATGEKRWETKVADEKLGFTMTSAPLVVEGHVVVGQAGGEYGARGFVAAYSPEDGKPLWRFEAVPGPGEPGNETWVGDSWKAGGASTWSTGTYDKERDVIYWTTGNPWPPLDKRVRAGDNLYSNSVVALDRKTGKLLWHYQFTPDDVHDWDATQQAILADVEVKGEKVPALIMASRNAFYYVLDRRDGKFLRATPFVKQTWNTGFDAKGKPKRDPASEPSPKGTLVWPWMHGGTNWWQPSYDAKRKLHFVPSVDAATLYFSIDMKYTAGEMTMGGTTRLATNQPAVMAIKAIDPETGDTRWSTRLDHGDFHHYVRIGGLLSTAGGIVFGGFEDRFVVLDSDTGKLLWRFYNGGLNNSAPATYTVDGVQYISVIASNVLFTFTTAPPTTDMVAATR
jgi:alcohol dehydrogenase (cytochrome c)